MSIFVVNADDLDKAEEDAGKICMEDRLRSLGLLGNKDDLGRESFPEIPPGISLKSTTFKDDHLWVEANISEKKVCFFFFFVFFNISTINVLHVQSNELYTIYVLNSTIARIAITDYITYLFIRLRQLFCP